MHGLLSTRLGWRPRDERGAAPMAARRKGLCAKMSDTVVWDFRRREARPRQARNCYRRAAVSSARIPSHCSQRPRNASRLMPVQRAVVGNGRVRAL